jgi:DNA repair protein RadA/Sms
LYDQDVFVSVVGGVKVSEPAADLAICLAVVSSLRNQALPWDTVVFGEVGLSGEVRAVQRGVDRVKEALKLGFARAIIPESNTTKHLPEAMVVVPTPRIGDAIGHAFG